MGDKPRLYPKEEKTWATREQMRVVLFLLALLLISVLALALAVSCRSYYYTPLV